MKPLAIARMLWDCTEPPRRVTSWALIGLVMIFASDQVFQIFHGRHPHSIAWWQALGAIVILFVFIYLLNLGRRAPVPKRSR